MRRMTRPTARAVLTAGMLALTLPVMAACEDEGPAEQLGENIDESAEEAGEAMEESAEALENEAEELREEAPGQSQ